MPKVAKPQGRRGNKGSTGKRNNNAHSTPHKPYSKLKGELRSLRRLIAAKGETVDAETRRDWDRKVEAFEHEIKSVQPANATEKEEPIMIQPTLKVSKKAAVSNLIKVGDRFDEELAQKYDVMYRTVKFVERKKATRRILAAKKINDAVALRKAELDLCYNVYYPRDQVYVGIFPDTAMEAADAVGTRAQKQRDLSLKIKEMVASRLAEGAISVEGALLLAQPRKVTLKPVVVGEKTIRGFDHKAKSHATKSKEEATKKLREQRGRERQTVEDVGDRLETEKPSTLQPHDMSKDDFFVVV